MKERNSSGKWSFCSDVFDIRSPPFMKRLSKTYSDVNGLFRVKTANSKFFRSETNYANDVEI